MGINRLIIFKKIFLLKHFEQAISIPNPQSTERAVNAVEIEFWEKLK